jgi:hypothetical protein
MNRIRTAHYARRPAGVLAWLASAVLASITVAPAAFASTSRGPSGPAPRNLAQLPGWSKHPPLPDTTRIHATLAGGMAVWQITLIAVGAAVLAAAVAVLFRTRATRRHVTAGAA